MSKEPITSTFTTIVGTATGFFTALILLLCMPVAKADKPAAARGPDFQTSRYVSRLGQQYRRSLQESISSSLHRFSSKDNATAIPDYQIYHSIFLKLLLDPMLAAGLSAEDLELIRTLPAISDRRFVSVAQDALAEACQMIDRSNAPAPAVVNVATNRMKQAQRKIERHLNGHYRSALAQLSDTGMQLVDSEYEKLVEQDSLVYTELDLGELGFAQPEFVFAFLQDTCANAERLLPGLVTDQLTLQQQMEDDYRQGAIQLYQPH